MARGRKPAAAETADNGDVLGRIPRDVLRQLERAGYEVTRRHDWVFPDGWPAGGVPAKCKRCGTTRSIEHAEQSCEQG